MSVTAKDFRAVAEALNRYGPTVATIRVTGALADYFASQNERFDRKRFLAAAGVSEEHIAAAEAPGVNALLWYEAPGLAEAAETKVEVS